LQLAKLLKVHFNTKLVLTIHYRKPNTSENIAFEKEFINTCCDCIIVLADHSYQSLLLEFHTDPSKIKIIPNAIKDIYNTNSIEKLQEIYKHYKISIDEKIILYVGRIDKNKNIQTLIKAFINVIETYENIRLVIAGHGDFEHVFKVIDHSWGKIVFTGFLSDDELYNLYKIAYIGVVPSIYEEFGYVAIEMMMHKIPIIANNTSGLAEIIENNISGKLITLSDNTQEDVIILSKAILHLLDNKELCIQMGENARKRFMKKYEMTFFRKEMTHLYDELFE
jgi:glycosyltransferase involved in cell wall biosynthesis